MPDTPLILHHYDFSNYAEKARLALGYKGLAWRGVTIPPVAPKPDLTPLTGGYRRTPVLQIGADVFCDTHLILRADGPGCTQHAARECESDDRNSE